MARLAEEGAGLIYAVAARFREAVLASPDSMLTPGRPVWSTEALAELQERFVQNPDTSKGSFGEKLTGQLSGATDDAIQLMGEIMLMHLLITSNITGDKKRQLLASVLDLMVAPIPVPPDIDAALDYGLAGPGLFFNQGRDRHISFLIRWMSAWRRLPPEAIERLLGDPWAFRQQLLSVEVDRAWLQRNAILHLVFPVFFERVLARKHKEKLVATFAHLIGDQEQAGKLDEDRALFEIRRVLSAEYGADMDFYSTGGVAAQWDENHQSPESPETPLLDRVLAALPGWTGFTDPRFVEEERDYKEKAAALAVSLLGREAFQELVSQQGYEELIERIKKVAQATNLLFFAVPRDGDLSLLFKEELDMPSFAAALFDLLHGDGSGPDRLERFAEYTTSRSLPTKWALPTYLLMLLHPDSDIFVKPGVTKWLLEELDAGLQMGSKASGEKYASLLEVVGALREDLAEYHPRDLIDIQGYIWVAHSYKPDKPEEEASPPAESPIYDHIGGSGFHFPAWLVTDYLLALATKPFVILSGISGTGKTKMALLVSQFMAPDQEIETVVSPGTAAFGDGFTPVQVQKSAFVYRRLTIPIGLLEDVALPDASKPTDLTVHAGGRAWQARLYVYSNARHVQVHMKPELNIWFAEHVQEGDYLGMRVRPAEGMPEFDLELKTAPSERRRELRPSSRVAFLSVRPDWTDNRALLGYYNPLMGVYSSTELLRLLLRAQANPDEPHFVVLDEMNLAKVEYYFSDFLSAMESETEMVLHDATDDQYVDIGEARLVVPRRLKVPTNVFFTGTVNVDETTYMFSPKVLDRANTIEFNEVHLESYGVSLPPGGDRFMLRGDVRMERLLVHSPASPEDWRALPQAYKERLRRLNDVLEPNHLHFGYRVVNEVARYLNLAASFVGEESLDTAFDLQILQKVLPKMAGNRGKLEKPLWNLLQWCVDPDGEPDVLSAATLESIDVNDATYPRAAAKLKRMLRVVQTVGFVSFVE